MIIEFDPTAKYDLKVEHLSAVAKLLHDVRRRCVDLHEPEEGDGDWSLGTRVYQRSYHALAQLSTKVEWLRMNSELKALQFSFRIGNVPMRIYKGDPQDPPSRYLNFTPGEEHFMQMKLEFEGVPLLDTVLRLAVRVDATRQAESVTLVEIDEYGEVIGTFAIPFEAPAVINITPMKAPPVALPPAVAIPLKKEAAKKKKETPINAVAN